MRRVVLLGVGLAVAIPVAGQAQEQEHLPHAEGVHEHFFLPEAVMRHQRDLQLKDEQREAIKMAVTELQTSVVQLQWELVDANQRLIEIVEGQSIDERAALQQLDTVLQLEGQVKRQQMRLLIQIKNTLTAEQQEQLDKLLKRYQTGMGLPLGTEHLEHGLHGHSPGLSRLEM